MLRAVVLFMLVVIAASCSINRKTAPIPNDFEVYLERTACYGTCPVYSMTIDDYGNVSYKGEANTDLKGTWKKELSFKQLNKLAILMQDSEFFSYDSLYDDRSIADLPSIIIRYASFGESHKVVFRYGGPITFRKLAAKIEAIVGEDGFELKDPEY